MASNTNRPIVGCHDIATNQFTEREMNDLEFADYQKEQAELKKEQEQIESNIAAKNALLQKLGITEDEAKLLLS